MLGTLRCPFGVCFGLRLDWVVSVAKSAACARAGAEQSKVNQSGNREEASESEAGR